MLCHVLFKLVVIVMPGRHQSVCDGEFTSVKHDDKMQRLPLADKSMTF